MTTPSLTWDGIPGWCDFEQYYQKLVHELPGGTLIEVGTYLGKSLCLLGDLVRKSGKPFTVIGVDTCRGTGIENGHDFHADAVNDGNGTFAGQLHKNVIDCGLADVVTIIVADSCRASQLFANNSVASVFLDAAHDEASVAKDITYWYDKVYPGGYIGGDDMGVPDEDNPVWPGVKAAVSKMLPGWAYHPHDAWFYRKQ